MNIVDWFSLAIVCLLGAATPGPSLAIILGHTFGSNKTAGRCASVAHAFAILFYAFATVFGLAKLFNQFPVVATTIVYAGAAYLLYLAANILKAANSLTTNELSDLNTKVSDNNVQATVENEVSLNTYVKASREAFLIGFLNPKLVFFFLALFSQFVPVDTVGLDLALILLGTVFFIDMLWYLMVVELADRSRSKLSVNNKTKVILLRSQAIIFLLIAVNSIFWR